MEINIPKKKINLGVLLVNNLEDKFFNVNAYFCIIVI